MENQITLQPCRLTSDDLGAPLPFDLYNGKGTLLVKKGTCLQEGAEGLLSQQLYKSSEDSNQEIQQAYERLESLYRRYAHVMGAWRGELEDIVELRRLAGDLIHLSEKHSDLCMATASHLKGGSHAIKHSFASAIVAVLLGNALGWHLYRQHILARAALTMNLPQLLMPDDAAGNHLKLNDAQREGVLQHPGLAAGLLSRSPHVEPEWILAVDQHHEHLDGTGYPLALKGQEIVPEARVLRIADAWCELVLLRAGRARKSPKEALLEMGKHVGSHFDGPMFQTLKKLMGTYPPGTFVRLANRETAIVVRWDKQGDQPKYATSVISPIGKELRECRVRPLGQHAFKIRDYTYLDMGQISRFSISRALMSASA
jgi:HD-GYP domain-containing protein (c-di-GMP phosphodiesterase class II)